MKILNLNCDGRKKNITTINTILYPLCWQSLWFDSTKKYGGLPWWRSG